MREARGDRAEVEALRLPGVEGRRIRPDVLHRRVVDGVAHLPARDVLEERRAGDRGRGARRIAEVHHARHHLQRGAVAREVQLVAQDVHASDVRAPDDGEQRVAGGVVEAGDRRVRRSGHGRPEQTDPRRLPRDRHDSGAAVIGDLRQRAVIGLLHEAIRRVVVDDLGGAAPVDRDREEVREVAVALRRDASGAEQTHVAVVHRMGRDSCERLGRRHAGDPAGAVDGEDDLRHEDVPLLSGVAARVDGQVLAIPDRVGTTGTAGLDPGEHVRVIAG